MGTGYRDTRDRDGDIAAAQRTWQQAKDMLSDAGYDLVVLDELTYMLADYLPEDEVISAITNRPESQSVVVTGRGGGPALREVMDTVSEVKEIKTPIAPAFVRAKAWITDDGVAPCDSSSRFYSLQVSELPILGLSVGAVFVLYTPLSPAVFSAGGLGLAVGTLIVATQYRRILVPAWFFRLSLIVELITLSGVAAVLILPIEVPLALFVYIGYQITFSLGELPGALRDVIDGCRRSAQAAGRCQAGGYLLGAVAWALYMGRNAGPASPVKRHRWSRCTGCYSGSRSVSSSRSQPSSKIGSVSSR